MDMLVYMPTTYITIPFSLHLRQLLLSLSLTYQQMYGNI